MNPRVIRGRLVDFDDEGGVIRARLEEDGALLIEKGRIAAKGPAAAILSQAGENARIDDHRGRLILPGFVDAHIHYPQTRVIASHGAQLLEWLEAYAFPEEMKFADRAHAQRVAHFFLDQLAREGTTTAAIFCSVHPQSAEALFATAYARDMRLIAGKCLMDRNAPEALLDTAERAYDETKALITRWHGRGRLGYGVTPRFAITSSPEELDVAGALLAEHEGVWLQTHLAENREEIAQVRALFPEAANYGDVYARHGLMGPRSLFAHAIHLEADERRALSESGSVAVMCPTSNLFIGSGLFDLAAAKAPPHPLRLALASDVGGGTGYSMLGVMGDAYKAQQLLGTNLGPLEAFHLATLGGARALGLEAHIGRLEPGHEADLVALDARATPAMAHRMDTVETLEEELFVLMTMGDDRAVAETYLAGRPAKRGLSRL